VILDGTVTIEALIGCVIEAKLAPLCAEVARLASQVEALRRAADVGEQYLSVEKAASIAEVHADTIRGWVKSGRLREHRAGRELRILRSDLCRFLASGSTSDGRVTAEEEAAAILARRTSR
jgi:excisionase family DNA binding protein